MTKKIKIVTDIANILAKKANSFALGISLAMLIASGLFLYNNFYAGWQDIKVLTVMKSQVATKVVNIASWNKINEQTTKKKELLGDWDIQYIPF